MDKKKVLVSVVLGNQTLKVGTLWSHTQKGRETASFEYDKKWLEHPERFALEPALKLTEGLFLHAGRHKPISCDRRFCARPLGPCSHAPRRKHASTTRKKDSQNSFRNRLSTWNTRRSTPRRITIFA